jgi:hypothetical protein
MPKTVNNSTNNINSLCIKDLSKLHYELTIYNNITKQNEFLYKYKGNRYYVIPNSKSNSMVICQIHTLVSLFGRIETGNRNYLLKQKSSKAYLFDEIAVKDITVTELLDLVKESDFTIYKSSSSNTKRRHRKFGRHNIRYIFDENNNPVYLRHLNKLTNKLPERNRSTFASKTKRRFKIKLQIFSNLIPNDYENFNRT